MTQRRSDAIQELIDAEIRNRLGRPPIDEAEASLVENAVRRDNPWIESRSLRRTRTQNEEGNT